MGKGRGNQLRRLTGTTESVREPPGVSPQVKGESHSSQVGGVTGVKCHQKPLRIRTVAEFDLQRAISIAADQMPHYRGFREEEQKR